MIAGEFAVLEPHQKLVVMAVDRFVYTTIEDSKDNHLTFENFNLQQLSWTYSDGCIQIASQDKRTEFVKQAMQMALNYLEERHISTDNFSLTIRSELDDSSGVKYGLGSSAAVVTSVITAILERFLPTSPSKKVIFKLAAISHVITQGNGSGADIAASTYGGMLKFASFQADWLIDMYERSETLNDLIHSKWTFLHIEQFNVPTNIAMYIGWTGKPASTANLVSKVLTLKHQNPKAFQAFIHDSHLAVDRFLQGMKQNETPLILQGVRQNREALRTVGEQSGAGIETRLLSELCDITEQFSGSGKPSGAGGGDCGIAFIPSHTPVNQLKAAWQKAGITPLDIQICYEGARHI